MVAALLALTLFTQTAQQPQSAASLPERFTAFGISLGDVVTESGTAQIEIVIERWSTPEELDRLFDAGEKGQRALTNAMAKLEPVGSIRTVQSLALSLHYAVQNIAEDGSRRIYLAMPRRVGFSEVMRGSRSVQYPITFVELHVDSSGEGDGELSLAARVTASSDRTRLYVLNYATRPVMLKSVRKRD